MNRIPICYAVLIIMTIMGSVFSDRPPAREDTHPVSEIRADEAPKIKTTHIWTPRRKWRKPPTERPSEPIQAHAIITHSMVFTEKADNSVDEPTTTKTIVPTIEITRQQECSTETTMLLAEELTTSFVPSDETFAAHSFTTEPSGEKREIEWGTSSESPSTSDHLNSREYTTRHNTNDYQPKNSTTPFYPNIISTTDEASTDDYRQSKPDAQNQLEDLSSSGELSFDSDAFPIKSKRAIDKPIGIFANNNNNPYADGFVRPAPRNKFMERVKNESSAERAERVQKGIHKLMHIVTIIGHVDSYLTKRFRSGFKKIAKLYEDSEEAMPTAGRKGRPLAHKGG